jgi:hypothetical protein
MAREGLSGVLGQRQNETDADPDQEQACEDPEQEGGLADRQPGDLGAIEKESRPPETTAVRVELSDLATHRVGGITGHTAVGVEIHDALASTTIAFRFGRHANSLALVPWAPLAREGKRRVPRRAGRVR